MATDPVLRDLARCLPRALARLAACLLGACGLGAAGTAGASDVADAGAIGDYRYCTVCHGATGNGNAAIGAPALAGIEPWYLRTRLQAYREGQLGHDFATDPTGTEMRTVARELDDGRMAGVAQYVASLPGGAPVSTVAGNAATGRRLYVAQCAVCHGARGEGNPQLHAPGLARLNDWYIIAAFGKYRSGLRGAPGSDPYAQQMRVLAESQRPDAAINDIAAYLHSRSH